MYGSYGLIQSADEKKDMEYTELRAINASLDGKEVG